MQFHANDPSALVVETFRRIQAERMSGLPMLNPALAVAAVGFALQDGREWRGILLTPWGLGLMLLPASADWPPVVEHQRVFREYASGNFAFLGNREEELGDYLICPLIHDMSQFADQTAAELTARACLIALDMAPAPLPAADQDAPSCSGRRKFLALGG